MNDKEKAPNSALNSRIFLCQNLNLMNKKEKIGIGIAVVISLLLFSIFLLTSRIKPKEISPTQNSTDPISLVYGMKIQKEESQTLLPEENLKTDNGATLEINGIIHQSEIKKETSVYDFMSKLEKEGKINFKEKNYLGMGKFIEELNGIKGNGDKFWIYYVNDKKAKIGISNYKINPGDVVSWKYEKDIN